MIFSKNYFSFQEILNGIRGFLAEADLPHVEFLTVLSFSKEKCEEEFVSENEFNEIIIKKLRKLDALSGVMIYDFTDGEQWDFQDYTGSLVSGYDEILVTQNSGLTVLFNSELICENKFPIVIVKKDFWDTHSARTTQMLSCVGEEEDYTTKISPAIYIELIFRE